MEVLFNIAVECVRLKGSRCCVRILDSGDGRRLRSLYPADTHFYVRTPDSFGDRGPRLPDTYPSLRDIL